jgi:hypothetical protein
MKNYKDFKQYFTKEEWEKFEANMLPDKKYIREPFGENSGYKLGLENYKTKNVFDYLDASFPWEETPEGSRYWNNLQTELARREKGYIV